MSANSARCHLATSLRVTIDPAKSWGWAVGLDGDAFWQPVFETHFGIETPVQVLKGVKDLGAILRYDRRLRLLSQTDRFAKAQRVIRRAARLPFSIKHKARLITSAAIPAALYGCEVLAIGRQHFVTLRGQITKALLKDRKAASPWAACSLLHPCVKDPEFVAIIRAARAARLFLLRSTTERRDKFYQLVANAKGIASRATGPASALSCYLSRVGLVLFRDGTLETATFERISFMHCAWPTPGQSWSL